MHVLRRPGRGVVEERKRAAGMQPRVVLPREACAATEPEVALLAAEAPEHRPVAASDLVDRVRVPPRHEEPVVALRLDRVDVEVVERLGLVLRHRLVRLGDGHVRRAVPLEQDLAARNRDLLDDGLRDLAVRRAAERREIGRDLPIDGEQRRVSLRDQELVDVAGEAVARGHVGDHVVPVVGDDVAAVSDAFGGLAAPPREDRPPAVALDAKVGDAVRVERVGSRRHGRRRRGSSVPPGRPPSSVR